MGHKAKKGLLDVIREASGFCYISDLRDRALALKKIRLPDKKKYSLKEWTDAVNYITEGGREFPTVEKAIEYLRWFLEEF